MDRGRGGGQPNLDRPGQGEGVPKSPKFVWTSLMDVPYRKKRTGNQKIGVMKFLALTLYLFATIILTLISSSAITGSFQNVSCQRFSLVIWSFEFPSPFSYALVSYSKNNLFYSVLVKIRANLLCVTNHYIIGTSKLLLPSVSRFKFRTCYKSRVNQSYI